MRYAPSLILISVGSFACEGGYWIFGGLHVAIGLAVMMAQYLDGPRPT